MQLLPVLVSVAVLFAIFFLVRIGGARRQAWFGRWPIVLLALAALALALRGAAPLAAGLGVLAAVLWILWPAPPSTRRRAPPPPAAPPPPREDPEDVEARRVLGVSLGASDAEIQSAFRARIAKAHPDRGGKHADAARLVAARDRLLGRRR